MKKSFIFASVFVGILMVSLVSAGWFTGNAIWGWSHCSSSNQCPAGEGDCDRDSDCATGLCSHNVGKKYNQHRSMDVCECPAGLTWDGTKCSSGTSESSGVTYQGIAEMFGDAETTGQIWLGMSQRNGEPIRITNGHTECGSNDECLLGFGGMVYPDNQFFHYDVTGLLSCDYTLNLDEMEGHNDWVEGSKYIVQYLCIDKELLEYADAGFPNN